MLKLTRKIEVVSNLAITVAAVLLAVVLVKNYLWPASTSPTRGPVADAVGRKLSLPNVDWARNGHTLIIALQPGCRFCTDSAPFYKEMIKRQATQQNVKLIAVLPSPAEDSKTYLGSLGVAIEDLRQASLDSIGVSGTPTLLLVDQNGVVTDAWRGKLEKAREAEVLARL